MKSYQLALDHRPTFVLAANNLAWMLATHPDDTLRDGKLARQLAEGICKQTKFKEPMLLDTLGAAYAESGDFEKAVKAVDRAISLLDADPNSSTDDPSMKRRKELYLQQQPYRDES